MHNNFGLVKLKDNYLVYRMSKLLALFSYIFIASVALNIQTILFTSESHTIIPHGCT